MKIAYIAGPYRGKTHYEIECNIRHAEKYAIKYWQSGYAVICPHKNTAHFDALAPDSIWLEGDLEILKRCDLIIMIPGWDESRGARAEHIEALNLGMEIIYEDKEC